VTAGAGGELDVHGGLGGYSVALEDLRTVLGRLLEDKATVQGVSFAVRGLDLWSIAALRHGVDIVGALTQLEWARRKLEERLAGQSRGLWVFAKDTRVAILRYEVAEELSIASVHAARSAVYSMTRAAQLGAGVFGMLDDGVAAPVELIPVDAESRIQLWDMASLVTSQSLLSGRPVVRVIEMPQPDGTSAWIVQIPGTQEWDPRAGEVAHDLTADIQLMSLQQAALAEAAVAALRAAQEASGRWGHGDPVLLSGHSLGGIVVMAIASDPELVETLNITHGLTMGSPVGIFDPSADVQVVSLEHTRDPIHGLDLTPNPDRSNWTTVTRDPGGPPWKAIDVDSHGAIHYRETARLAARAAEDGTDPSLAHWAATAAPFFRRPTGGSGAGRQVPAGPSTGPGEQQVRDYRVRRVTESRS